MATYYKREPQDDQERQLLVDGWKFAGVSLFWHSSIPYKYFTKDQAVEHTIEQGLGIYCSVCGACGVEGCCPPDMCKCLYGDDYKRDYLTMVKDWDKMFDFIKQLTSQNAYIDKHVLAKQAQTLIDNLGEYDEHGA